jgi:hypothetical protein
MDQVRAFSMDEDGGLSLNSGDGVVLMKLARMNPSE